MEEKLATHDLMVREQLLHIHHKLSDPDGKSIGVPMSNVNSHIDVNYNVRGEYNNDVKSKNPQADAQVGTNMDVYMQLVGSQ